MHNAAYGIDDSKVAARSSKTKSISISETLPYDCTNEDKLKELKEYVINKTNEADIVKEQKENSDIKVKYRIPKDLKIQFGNDDMPKMQKVMRA